MEYEETTELNAYIESDNISQESNTNIDLFNKITLMYNYDFSDCF
jgi:hypothetical protein